MKPTEMHTELNGNPPTITKRKKNRDKKQSTKLETSDLNPSYCSYFSSSLSSHPNLNATDNSSYYSILNHSVPSEPMSLPVYPFSYPHLTYPSPSYFNGFPNAPLVPPSIPSVSTETQEYMSLPVGTVDQNDNTSKRRFSDPGLPNDSDSSTNSFEGRLIQKLTQQVHALRESNRKLSRDVMDMRLELNLIKQQQNSRIFERDYEPGMLADVIREVRDAARVREDALLARVKHMIEERQLSINQMHLVAEKNRNNDRIAKLEEQMKNLNVAQNRSDDGTPLPSTAAIEDGSSAARQVLELEREALVLRRELQDARAKKEESDQRLQQLDKKLYNILRRSGEVNGYDGSEDGKTTSIDTFSITTSSSSASQPALPPRVTLSGPVTDL